MIEREQARDGCQDTAPCGCCEGTEPITPEATANRPGLPALAYRVGRHATFLETMKARLSSWLLEGGNPSERQSEARYPLAGLRTRDPSDPSLALLDGWATVADVLTFYQERIANEGFLRTATERRSILELARLVGYRLRPGVASSVFLAYTIDENTKEEVVIPKGARSQSVPGPEELPQSFETSEDLAARSLWNNLKPRQTQPQTWATITQPSRPPSGEAQSPRIYLKGVTANLKPGDPLLIEGGPQGPALYRIEKVEPQSELNRTKVSLSPWSGPAGDPERFEAVTRTIDRLTGSAPRGGAKAELAKKHLRAVGTRAPRARSPGELHAFIRDQTLPLLGELRRETDPAIATRLAPWLAEAEAAMTDLLQELTGRNGTAATGTQAGTMADVNRLELLTKPPSRPLPNSLRLPRSLEKSFTPWSDAGLQVLGTVRPELQVTLPVALSTYDQATPAPRLKAHALRLKAGLFGRNFPPRQRMVRGLEGEAETTEVQVIGEWPIVRAVRPDGDGGLEVDKATESPGLILLDASYEGIIPDSWVVLDFGAVPVEKKSQVIPTPFADREAGEAASPLLVTRVSTVQTKVSRSEYGGTGDTTRVALEDEWITFRITDREVSQDVVDSDFQVIRSTAVYAQSEELELAEEPVETPVCGGAAANEMIELDRFYSGLQPGRFVIITGERADLVATTKVPASEAAMLVEVLHDVRQEGSAAPQSGDSAQALPGDRIHTFIRLQKPLSYCYKRDTVTIYGNVVKATHGETCGEVLGSGDGAQPFQTFALKQRPVTFVAAATPAGAESTLQVFVNDVRWHEADSFTGLAATAHRFVPTIDDESRTQVIFGDGATGARLPTGSENVKAVYRRGIGKGGNVRPGQVSLLTTRPLGVKEVINPLRASGGAGAEGRDQARKNVPLAVKALDRLVSTRDYQDFARTFAGIGKASAVELTNGRKSVVHVTIAGIEDIPIDIDSDLYLNLRRALADFGDPSQQVMLATRELFLLVTSASLRLLPDYQWEPVVTAVRTAVLETFGFERRELGQEVVRSEILSAIQAVPGVGYVDLDAMGAIPETVPDPLARDGRRVLTPSEIAAKIAEIVQQEIHQNQPAHRIPVHLAEFSGTGVSPAQLAMLAPQVPATLILNQIS